MKSERILEYINKWKKMDYEDDIPDECPNELSILNLAPSYKAIAICILKNDNYFTGLGFSAHNSHWYSLLKKIEIDAREK